MSGVALRAAVASDLPAVWAIMQQAIEQRRQAGSLQWQNGYPNEQVIRRDIAEGLGFVLIDDHVIEAYAAVMFGVEPAYEAIDGQWLTTERYAVVHRVARSEAGKGTGVGTRLFERVETMCADRGACSIRLDTNFDNAPMLRIIARMNYIYCGEIMFEGASRRAYEKVLRHDAAGRVAPR